MFKRLFIALTIPENIRISLFKSISEVYGANREMKKIPIENIHLTLKFLGDIPTDRIEKISQTVKQTSERFERFDYSISESPGAFPSLKSARVMFARVSEGSEKIEDVFTELEDRLSRIKIRKQPQKFVSHITLARIRQNMDVTGSCAELKFEVENPVLCSNIVLFESILKPSGAEYIIINDFELK